MRPKDLGLVCKRKCQALGETEFFLGKQGEAGHLSYKNKSSMTL